jgi:hypothetical protein
MEYGFFSNESNMDSKREVAGLDLYSFVILGNV